MKAILTSIIVCFGAIAGLAQENADIEVSYRYSHPVQTMRSAEPDMTNQYILLTDGSRSKFYSPKEALRTSGNYFAGGVRWRTIPLCR